MVILLNLSKSCKVSAYKVWPSPSFLMSIRAWQELNWSPQKLVGLNESRFFWLRVLSTKWNEDPYLFVKPIAFDFIGNYFCISNPKYQLHSIRTLNHICLFPFLIFIFLTFLIRAIYKWSLSYLLGKIENFGIRNGCATWFPWFFSRFLHCSLVSENLIVLPAGNVVPLDGQVKCRVDSP